MAQTLKDWYLARLRSLAASRSGKTPMGLVAQDNQMLQQYVLEASKDRSAQKQKYYYALLPKERVAIDYFIMIAVIGGISTLLALALVPGN
jgi:hypothetical protein